jgi:hypothetical protein
MFTTISIYNDNTTNDIIYLDSKRDRILRFNNQTKKCVAVDDSGREDAYISLYPTSACFDNGNLLVVENDKIRKIDFSKNEVTIVAGSIKGFNSNHSFYIRKIILPSGIKCSNTYIVKFLYIIFIFYFFYYYYIIIFYILILLLLSFFLLYIYFLFIY